MTYTHVMYVESSSVRISILYIIQVKSFIHNNDLLSVMITVELLITDPPRSDHPLYNGQPLWNGLNLS